MGVHVAAEREIREVLIAANCGEASDAQLARLDELVRSDFRLAGYSARMLEQQAALAWQGVQRERSSVAPDAVETDSIEPQHANSSHDAVGGRSERLAAASWAAIAASLAFVMGAGAATLAWRGPLSTETDEPGIAAAPSLQDPADYEARLVRSTACLWDPSSIGSRDIGSSLTSGESLDLLEGLAGINLRWSKSGTAVLSLEGPAAMMLNNGGMPTLRFGKLTATITADRRPFVMETPVGRLSIGEYGSIGVAAFGNEAEIHVFDGTAELQLAWLSPSRSRSALPAIIEAGEAIRIQIGENGELAVKRHSAEQSYFVTQVSMASDTLIVPSAYVEAVKALKPIGYWRMERTDWPRIRNAMGPRFECRVNGSIASTGLPGNQGIEFGVTDQGGDLLCDEVFDDVIGDSYSLEVWIKPSHYHVGAVASLVGDMETPTGVAPHGMLLEMGGSGLMPTAVHHPGRIRFLHRSPASNDSQLGTSCYSTAAYNLRKWQHLVAVKDGARMRLYINGQLAGEGEDSSELPSGLRMLIGRLYPERQIRPFKGQLDELALYNRALSAEEVEAHYRLIRPQIAPSKPSI